MRKKLVSLALAATIMVSTSLPAFATKKFDMSIFDGRQDVWFTSDEMKGETYVFPYNMGNDGESNIIYADDGSSMGIGASLEITDSYDYYNLSFSRSGATYMGLYEVIVKIGDNRYTLWRFSDTASTFDEFGYFECVTVPMKKELIPFMNDLIEHKDDKIKVRFVGSYISYDFVLTDTMKTEILTMYDLFVDGNGTREKNLHDLTEWGDKTIVEKNGKVIQGNITEKILTAALDSALHS